MMTKAVEIFKGMRCYGRNQDGLIKGNGGPRPTALVVIRCRISVARLFSERKLLFSSAYLPYLASPSERPRKRFLPELLHRINW